MKIFAVIVSMFATHLVAAAGFDQGHTAFDAVLKRHVRDEAVDYAGLKASPKALTDYLNQLAAVAEADFKRWPEKERLAFLINVYNAATLKLVVDHYPINSVKDIGRVLKGPFKQEVVHLFGRVMTLHAVEHEMIRKQYREPRAHFALVCAARGCPPLRSEPYVGSRLNEQLDDQGRIFMRQTQKNRADPKARFVYLSPIFKWFSGDFEAKSRSVQKFLEPYWPEPDRSALAAGNFKVRYTDYDWSLNEQKGRKGKS